MAKKMAFMYPSEINLFEGTISSEVEKLQIFLEHFGYLKISSIETLGYEAVRGAANAPEATFSEFDRATVTALKNYQRFHGLQESGFLDEATVVHMTLPRCGFPDIPDSQGLDEYRAQGNKWNKNHLTYGFKEFAHELTPQQVRGAIKAALDLWSNVSPLTFQEVDLATSPDFVIRFVSGHHGDDSPFDGVGNVLAHAFYPPPNGGDIAGDAHFDESEVWSVDIPVPTGSFDLITVAAHEFGHSLGLAHSSVRGALMYPTYNGPQRHLAQDDIDGIRSIYNLV